MGATITIRVPDDIEKNIENISRIEHLDKSTVVRRLLSKAVQEWENNDLKGCQHGWHSYS